MFAGLGKKIQERLEYIYSLDHCNALTSSLFEQPWITQRVSCNKCLVSCNTWRVFAETHLVSGLRFLCSVCSQTSPCQLWRPHSTWWIQSRWTIVEKLLENLLVRVLLLRNEVLEVGAHLVLLALRLLLALAVLAGQQHSSFCNWSNNECFRIWKFETDL